MEGKIRKKLIGGERDGEDKLSLGISYEPRPGRVIGMTLFVVPVLIPLLGEHDRGRDRDMGTFKFNS